MLNNSKTILDQKTRPVNNPGHKKDTPSIAIHYQNKGH